MIGNRKISSWKSTSSKYGRIWRLLHWLVALSIFILFIMGLWMVELNYYHPLYQSLPWIHKSLGMLVLMMMMIRLLWRFIDVIPQLGSGYSKWQRRMARWMHALLYMLIFIIIVSGYLLSTSEGASVDIFGWFSVPAIITYSDQNDSLGWLHLIASYCLFGLILLHVIAAIKEYVLKR